MTEILSNRKCKLQTGCFSGLERWPLACNALTVLPTAMFNNLQLHRPEPWAVEAERKGPGLAVFVLDGGWP